MDVFFVISGFLITYLLLKESETRGTIRLKDFYFRRFFRIFPPFYVFLGVVASLWITGLVAQNPSGFHQCGYVYMELSTAWTGLAAGTHLVT